MKTATVVGRKGKTGVEKNHQARMDTGATRQLIASRANTPDEKKNPTPKTEKIHASAGTRNTEANQYKGMSKGGIHPSEKTSAGRTSTRCHF